jgi:small subunit ribosomal protein S19
MINLKKNKLFIINEQLIMKKVNLKTYNRNSIILPNFVGKIVQVHNGNTFIKITVIQEMIGHKLGEFVKTRKTFKFKSKKKKK